MDFDPPKETFKHTLADVSGGTNLRLNTNTFLLTGVLSAHDNTSFDEETTTLMMTHGYQGRISTLNQSKTLKSRTITTTMTDRSDVQYVTFQVKLLVVRGLKIQKSKEHDKKDMTLGHNQSS